MSRRNSVPESICLAPWTNFQLDVNGEVRPCCKFEQPGEDSEYRFPNLKDASLEDIWQSDTYKRLRKDFLDGKKPDACRACWEEEKAGARSYRQSMDTRVTVPDDFDFTDLSPKSPGALDLKLSNVCNLKCRICGPVASSLWLKEYLDDPLLREQTDSFLTDNRQYFLQNKVTRQAANRTDLENWLPGLQLIELTGGEPLLSTENIELLEICFDSGHASHIDLLIVTNGTIFKPRLVEMMDRFKSVTINLSIDDIGDRFEYQRHPAKWAKVDKVIDQYLTQCSDKYIFNCHTTVSVFNVYYMPEFIEWFIEKDKKREWTLLFNILYYNREMCIQNMPVKVKKRVTAKLNKFARQLGEQYTYIADGLFNIIEYMNGDQPRDQKQLWERFLVQNDARDRFRNENYFEVFNEFHTLSKESEAPLEFIRHNLLIRTSRLHRRIRNLLP